MRVDRECEGVCQKPLEIVLLSLYNKNKSEFWNNTKMQSGYD